MMVQNTTEFSTGQLATTQHKLSVFAGRAGGAGKAKHYHSRHEGAEFSAESGKHRQLVLSRR